MKENQNRNREGQQSSEFFEKADEIDCSPENLIR